MFVADGRTYAVGVSAGGRQIYILEVLHHFAAPLYNYL